MLANSWEPERVARALVIYILQIEYIIGIGNNYFCILSTSILSIMRAENANLAVTFQHRGTPALFPTIFLVGSVRAANYLLLIIY